MAKGIEQIAHNHIMSHMTLGIKSQMPLVLTCPYRVVQETSPQTPLKNTPYLMDLTLGLKSGPQTKDGLFKLGGVFSHVGPHKIW